MAADCPQRVAAVRVSARRPDPHAPVAARRAASRIEQTVTLVPGHRYQLDWYDSRHYGMASNVTTC